MVKQLQIIEMEPIGAPMGPIYVGPIGTPMGPIWAPMGPIGFPMDPFGAPMGPIGPKWGPRAKNQPLLKLAPAGQARTG